MSNLLVEPTKLSALVMLEALTNKEDFTLHAQALFESQFISVGENDIEKKKCTQKFTKRLNAMSKDMDSLHKVKGSLVSALKEFKCAYKIVCNDLGYVYLAKLYAGLDYSLKEYSKVVKAQKNNPELLEILEPYSFLLESNAFDMMKKDFEYLETVMEERQKDSKKKNPDFVPRSEIKFTPDWEAVKDSYKQQLSSLKASK